MNAGDMQSQATAHANKWLATSTLAAAWPQFMVGQAGNPVRVLVVDDDAHLCHVVVSELMSDERVVCVGQAHSLREGRRAVRQLTFDVMLVDINLTDGSGLELLSLLRAVRPAASSIVISVMEGDDQLMRAIELGAAGYLVKHCWFGNYVQSVLQVANGGACITPHLARRLLQRLAQGQPAKPSKDGERLSVRECEILRHVASGYNTHEIASQLGIAVLTVNTHVRNIYRKLQVKSRAQAVRAALLYGLL